MSAHEPGYFPSDVVWALLLHDHTADAVRNSWGKYIVEGKERPLLIIGYPTARGNRQTLEFTSQCPTGEIAADFLHRPGKSVLWKFTKQFGLPQECYLNIAETHSIPTKHVRKVLVRFNEFLFRHILKEMEQYRLRPRQATNAVTPT